MQAWNTNTPPGVDRGKVHLGHEGVVGVSGREAAAADPAPLPVVVDLDAAGVNGVALRRVRSAVKRDQPDVALLRRALLRRTFCIHACH